MKKAIEEPSSLAFCDHFFKDIWLQYCLENKDESPALPPILNDAIQRIHQCLPRALSVAELARDLHVSHVYLIQLFKKHLNVTPTDYVIGFRLEQAKLLLSDTDEPISTLAERCGFSNAYYFSTLFKKKTGLSPGVYRKMYRV
jgi:AraC-like DNA-binding protein